MKGFFARKCHQGFMGGGLGSPPTKKIMISYLPQQLQYGMLHKVQLNFTKTANCKFDSGYCFIPLCFNNQ